MNIFMSKGIAINKIDDDEKHLFPPPNHIKNKCKSTPPRMNTVKEKPRP